MSNPAQEEADRLFSNKIRTETHPEDRNRPDDDSDSERSENDTSRRNIRSGRLRADRSSDDDEDNDADNLTTASNSKTSYSIPSTSSYANTGPKGVIADAQSYHRSKRRGFDSGSQPFSSEPVMRHAGSERPAGLDEDNKNNDDDDDEDDGFMKQWREQRLAELRQQQQQRSKINPSSFRTFGRLTAVDADGYLDAIDKSSPDAVVVVLLYDSSPESAEVGTGLERLAYTWSQIHFVKLPHEIAEMQTMDVPAILAYRGGEVFATISGAHEDGLEHVLKQQGVLPLR